MSSWVMSGKTRRPIWNGMGGLPAAGANLYAGGARETNRALGRCRRWPTTRASREGDSMIDHVGFPVSDYARSRAFYEKALAPLGYTLIMEVQQREHDAKAAGFGADRKPDFWIGGEGGLNGKLHIAIVAKD